MVLGYGSEVLLGLGLKESRRTSRIRSHDGKDVLVLVPCSVSNPSGPVFFSVMTLF